MDKKEKVAKFKKLKFKKKNQTSVIQALKT